MIMRLVRRRSTANDRLFAMPLVLHIALILVIAIVSAIVLGFGLWWSIGQPSITTGKPWTANETFDFVKIVLAIVGGIGAVVALVVSYRKQHLGEAAENRQEAAEAREDARLFGEDFARATEQLGSTEAPVRLAGMYTLERLGQDTPAQQQTIVNVLCAYLRMPYTPPEDDPPEERSEKNERRRQEREVRLTAQRILANSLRTNQVHTHWDNIHLDLTGATLFDFDFDDCKLNTALFENARFSGRTRFNRAKFDGIVKFREAEFDGIAKFDMAHFCADAEFVGVQFDGIATFNGTKIDGHAMLIGTQFDETVKFDMAHFCADASFVMAQFNGIATFNGTKIDGDAIFIGAQFGATAKFAGAEFDGGAWLNAQFDGKTIFDTARFSGDAMFSEAQFREAVRFNGTRVRIDVPESVLNYRTWPQGYDILEPTTPEERRLPGREGQWGYLTPNDPDRLQANGLDSPGSSDTAAAN